MKTLIRNLMNLSSAFFIMAGVLLPGMAQSKNPFPEFIAQGGAPVTLETVATGLTGPNWGTAARGDSSRLFVTDQNGILWAIDLGSGSKSVFADLSGRLVGLGIAGPGTFDERGLLGVAFHPNYQAHGLLYTYTSEPVNGPANFSTMPLATERPITRV